MRFLWNIIDMVVWACVVGFTVFLASGAMYGATISQGPSPIPGAVMSGGFWLVGWHWFRFMSASEKGIAPTRELLVFPTLLTAIYIIACVTLYLL